MAELPTEPAENGTNVVADKTDFLDISKLGNYPFQLDCSIDLNTNRASMPALDTSRLIESSENKLETPFTDDKSILPLLEISPSLNEEKYKLQSERDRARYEEIAKNCPFIWRPATVLGTLAVALEGVRSPNLGMVYGIALGATGANALEDAQYLYESKTSAERSRYGLALAADLGMVSSLLLSMTKKSPYGVYAFGAFYALRNITDLLGTTGKERVSKVTNLLDPQI
ncbi:MAG: hypothetical protein K2X77_27525 [Candidatus Obscuribacterales bacterium]|jgi:hypothetical protein|nr:hypothetical protein [Candidatus Obscuribacterales bacterium]